MNMVVVERECRRFDLLVQPKQAIGSVDHCTGVRTEHEGGPAVRSGSRQFLQAFARLLPETVPLLGLARAELQLDRWRRIRLHVVRHDSGSANGRYVLGLR